MVDSSDEITETNLPSPEGRYSLDDATRGLPFTIDTPIPPRIVTEQVVTPSTIGRYINTPGMRLILTAGAYGNITMDGADKEIVLTTDVIINDLAIYTGQRIVVRANPVRTGTISRIYVGYGGQTNNFSADILFDGISANSTAPPSGEQSLLWTCNRIAFINSRIRSPRWTIASFGGIGGGVKNLIMGNNELISWAGQAIRVHSAQNFALVDNRLYEEVTSSSLRLHTSPGAQRSDNIYIGRNQFEGGFWQIKPIGDGATSNNTPGMGSVWVENNNVYSVPGWFIKTSGLPQVPVGERDHAGVVYFRNNNLYSNGGIWPSAGVNDWVATISGNTAQGYVAPPVWVILGDDVIIAENNANRINAILDGYTVPSILAGLQYPVDPATTTPHEVRNNSELASAVGGNARLIRIYGPGNRGQSTYNQFDLSGRSDIDIVMDNDATISGNSGWAWRGSVRRLRWTGGNINIASGSADGFRIHDAEDLLFDDVRMFRGGTDGHIFYPGTANHRRFAMINSSVEFTASGPGIYYAVFSAGTASNRGDWILLNNRFIGQGPPVRLMNMGLRTAIVGNYFSEFRNNASIRIHLDIDKLWFAHNVSVHGGGTQPNFTPQVTDQGKDTDAIMHDFLIEKNRFFATQPNINSGSVYRAGDIVESNRSQAANWVFLNNIWSDPTGPAGGETFSGVFIDVPYIREGDLRVGPGHPSYETAPSASGFGAAR